VRSGTRARRVDVRSAQHVHPGATPVPPVRQAVRAPETGRSVGGSAADRVGRRASDAGARRFARPARRPQTGRSATTSNGRNRRALVRGGRRLRRRRCGGRRHHRRRHRGARTVRKGYRNRSAAETIRFTHNNNIIIVVVIIIIIIKRY